VRAFKDQTIGKIISLNCAVKVADGERPTCPGEMRWNIGRFDGIERCSWFDDLPAAGSQATYPVYLFFAARNFAQRARAAAAILFLPAAEIFRVRFAGAEAIATAGCDPFRTFAHRFFCARLILFRADADNVRCPFELELPKAASAAVKRWTS